LRRKYHNSMPHKRNFLIGSMSVTTGEEEKEGIENWRKKQQIHGLKKKKKSFGGWGMELLSPEKRKK